MARIKRQVRRIERTLKWTLSGDRKATVELVMTEARAWYDSDESREPGWLVTDVDSPGTVLAARLTLL